MNTRCRVSGATRELPANASDAVEGDTPARAATDASVGRVWLGTVQTVVGPIQVDTWASRHPRMRHRGDVVVLGMPRTAHIVEGSSC